MKQYLDAVKCIIDEGTHKPAARENMPGTKSLFGYQMAPIDLSKGFPLLTTKKINFNHVVIELLWFLKGETNVKYLIDRGVNIWNEDSYAYYCKVCARGEIEPMSFSDYEELIKGEDDVTTVPWFTNNDTYFLGDCGKQYGAQWRNFNGKTDQIKDLIDGLRNNPTGRRHIVSAWNPSELDDLALHPCHTMFQFNCRPIIYGATHPNLIEADLKPSEVDAYVEMMNLPKYYLDCKMYQRSADSFLGVPYNIASYALLTHLIADMCGMVVGNYIHTFGDLHIYDNHMDQVDEQLTRDPHKLPKLSWTVCQGKIDKETIDMTVDEYLDCTENIHLKGYEPQSRIKAELSTGIKK